MPPAPEALEQAFLDDIVGNPNDPSLWHILADWLEEREDPRAELVRLTWQLQHEAEHADFAKRQKRVQALLAGGMKPVRPRCTLDEIEFAWIAPGSFLMGSHTRETDRSGDEALHRVTLSTGFWMGVAPVTQAQWRAVMGNNPSRFKRGGKKQDRDRYPVENVTWEAAVAFCAALGTRIGRVIRLPTEAEWEYACRAGTRTPFHFGSVFNGKQGNCNGMNPYREKEGPYLKRPSVVGSYPPNAWGLCDMHGNVWEWCQDIRREDYENLPAVDPLEEEQNDDRHVIRGGSWSSDGFLCRSAFRGGCAPENIYNLPIGFRVVVAGPE
jgi:uncharacterized protein (TIGR02996 family)